MVSALARRFFDCEANFGPGFALKDAVGCRIVDWRSANRRPMAETGDCQSNTDSP
jgi:hypothetical protein